uniref:Uncharacterized protein n=1 Tax=Apteryx owenii TaxID=8824 RepID=A0A8B9PJG5_APTOW
ISWSREETAAWAISRGYDANQILFQRGYDWYYNKYIKVRKGGLGGITLVPADYVAVSYIWSYDYLKQDCCRKYY